MRGKSFVPPPRSIDNILNVIAKKSTKDTLAWKNWEKRSKIELPANATKNELIPFYLSRGEDAFNLGLYGQSQEDYQNVYELVGPEKASDRLIFRLASSELNIQNYEKAATLFTILKERNSLGFLPYYELAYIFALTGQFEKAERIKDEGLAYQIRSGKYGTTEYYNAMGEFYKARLEYTLLNMRAKYIEAEPIIRRTVDVASVVPMPHGRLLLQVERIRLIRNLIEQNRLVEAELEARKTIEDSIKFLSEESVHLLAANTILAEVLLAQGRLTDAEKVNQASVQGYEQLDLALTFGWWSRSIETLARSWWQKVIIWVR